MKIQNSNPRTLTVGGLTELVAANAMQMRDDIRAMLNPTHTTLELDLSSVSFLDSSSLGMLISLNKTMRARNGAVRLLKPGPRACQILEMTRLNRVFEIVSTETSPHTS